MFSIPRQHFNYAWLLLCGRGSPLLIHFLPLFGVPESGVLIGPRGVSACILCELKERERSVLVTRSEITKTYDVTHTVVTLRCGVGLIFQKTALCYSRVKIL